MQREKIEELSRLYQEKEKEVAARGEKERALQEEIEKLTEMAAYKTEWQELKWTYESLLKKN